jgi:hypothetical protein
MQKKENKVFLVWSKQKDLANLDILLSGLRNGIKIVLDFSISEMTFPNFKRIVLNTKLLVTDKIKIVFNFSSLFL